MENRINCVCVFECITSQASESQSGHPINFVTMHTDCSCTFACYFTSDLSQCCKSQKGNPNLLFSLCTPIALACYCFGLILRNLVMQFF